jgi:hypothetical protein
VSEGMKFDGGKPDLSMIPLGGCEAVARVLMFGAEKYNRGNWRMGFKDSRLIAASLRHLMAYTNGEKKDPESGLCHLDHALFGIMVVCDQQRRREAGVEVGEDDLPDDSKVERLEGRMNDGSC